jgi:hypothetical protein
MVDETLAYDVENEILFVKLFSIKLRDIAHRLRIFCLQVFGVIVKVVSPDVVATALIDL